ncbi:unnamed protein product, partial [Effrenium voratum]
AAGADWPAERQVRDLRAAGFRGVRHVATEVPGGALVAAGPELPHAFPGEPGHREDGGGPHRGEDLGGAGCGEARGRGRGLRFQGGEPRGSGGRLRGAHGAQ